MFRNLDGLYKVARDHDRDLGALFAENRALRDRLTSLEQRADALQRELLRIGLRGLRVRPGASERAKDQIARP